MCCRNVVKCLLSTRVRCGYAKHCDNSPLATIDQSILSLKLGRSLRRTCTSLEFNVIPNGFNCISYYRYPIPCEV